MRDLAIGYPVSLEAVRYVVNGVVATAVHYAVLRLLLDGFDLPSAGAANFLAASVGITTSFFGSRYFVFRKREEPILHQARRFVLLYGAIACLHAVLLFVWTDLLRLDYTAGFAVGIVIQVIGSYFGNKYLVFLR